MKTVFDATVRKELIDRVNRVTPTSQRKFGKMNPNQALHHVNTALQAYLGEVKAEYHGNALKAGFLKLFTFSPIPIPPEKGKTAPEFVAGGSYNLNEEKARFKDLIERVGSRRSQVEWPVSPVFGKLTAKQYGELGYKHTDHHLKQFGV